MRPARTDRAALAAAYDDLETLLPGPGSLWERYRALDDYAPVPATTIEALMADVVEEARARTRDLFGLPDGESIELEYVRDTPWLGYHEYLGDLRGRISVNVDKPRSAISLLGLASTSRTPATRPSGATRRSLSSGARACWRRRSPW